MNSAVERLKEALAVGGKVRGYRKPIYLPDGSLYSNAQQHIMVLAGDLAEACAQSDQEDATVKIFAKAAASGAPDRKIGVLADQLFHVLDLCKAK
jgi:hypothetical protein